jgi:hypothetical protein
MAHATNEAKNITSSNLTIALNWAIRLYGITYLIAESWKKSKDKIFISFPSAKLTGRFVLV